MTVTLSKDVALNRNTYIGGSEIAAVMGLSRWCSPLKLWAIKTGKLQPADLSDNEAVQLGSELEEFVAQKFSKETGKKVRKAPKVYQHPQYPYMVAHIDRLIVNSDELLECKTCSFFKKDEWQDEEIPQEYILQVIWYLGITGRKIGHVACLIGGQKFVQKKVEFNQELFNRMVETAKEFWQCVQNEQMPKIMANDDETLSELYPNGNEKIVELYPSNDREESAELELNTWVAALQQVKDEIKLAEVEKKELETKIKNVIRENDGIKTTKYVVTWKNQSRKTLDTDGLKMEYPELFSKYQVESSFRRLNVKTNKDFEIA